MFLLNKSKDNLCAKHALGAYTLFMNGVRLKKNFRLSHYKHSFCSINLAKVARLPSVKEIHQQLPVRELEILGYLVESRINRELRQYNYLMKVVCGQRLKTREVAPFLAEYVQLITEGLANIEATLPRLLELCYDFEHGHEAPSKEELEEVISDVYQAINWVHAAVWYSRFFRWVLESYLGKHLGELSLDLEAVNLRPCNGNDEATENVKPGDHAAVADLFRCEREGVRDKPVTQWFYWFRLITAPVHYASYMDFPGLPKLPALRLVSVEFSSASEEMLPWREGVQWVYRFHPAGTAEEVIFQLEKVFGNSLCLNMFNFDGIVPDFTTHPEAMLAVLRHIAQGAPDNEFLESIHNAPALLACSIRCCGVCSTIINSLDPWVHDGYHLLPAHGKIIPSALPIGFPEGPRKKIMRGFEYLLRCSLDEFLRENGGGRAIGGSCRGTESRAPPTRERDERTVS